MLKKLDNRFSVSWTELQSQINDFIEGMDYEKEKEKCINSIKEYLGDDILYYEWINYIQIQLHLSIPIEVKEKCNVCKGERNLSDNIICGKYFLLADDTLLMYMSLFILSIENNRHLFNSEEILLSVTNKFFENLEFNKGELILDADRLDNIILTHSIIMLRESFAEKDTLTAISEINEMIGELETHKVIAASTDRELSDFVKPQLKFLKKQLDYYKGKLLIEPSKESVDNSFNKEALFELSNNLIPRVSIEQVYNYFKILTQMTNKNNEFYLTNEQLVIFIKSTFVERKPIQQDFNCKGFKKKEIRKVFYDFYFQNKNKERNQTSLKGKYFNIMNDAFSGFNKNDYDDFAK